MVNIVGSSRLKKVHVFLPDFTSQIVHPCTEGTFMIPNVFLIVKTFQAMYTLYIKTQ